ncbi:MAG: cystathionine beta-lyase [Alphaproteobacteria bacterium]|nr:cystathionine beta-lyase [Alphaproteobacteria bacterium]
MSKNKNLSKETRTIHSGYDPSEYYGIVNAPVVRTSTIIYKDLAAYESPDTKFRYGRYTTPLVENFCSGLTELENGYASLVASSGLSAITTALMAFLKTGDHVLLVDSLYPPARFFANRVLTKMGIEVEYYDPKIGAGIEKLVKDNTAVIYMESPGSATYDVQDVPAIVKVAKKYDIITMLDNSWASGVFYNPLDHGVNLSILSVTKYINGHSDAMLGAVVADSEKIFKQLQKCARDLGVCAGSEEVSLSLRGLKTIHIRMKEAGERALVVAKWLEKSKHISRVYHPALPSHPSHKLWKRDFSGCNGLITIVLKPYEREAVRQFIEGMEIFAIGSSWGGYESLMQPQYMEQYRSAVKWEEKGFVLRLQIGFEDPKDLIADLEQAMGCLK